MFDITQKVGSGVYRVKTTNDEFNVYCNMGAGFDGYTSILDNFNLYNSSDSTKKLRRSY